MGISLHGENEFCKPTKMKRKIVVLSFVNTPRILSPGIKSEEVIADEAKFYVKPPTPALVGLLT